jgi:hypothetical protein
MAGGLYAVQSDLPEGESQNGIHRLRGVALAPPCAAEAVAYLSGFGFSINIEQPYRPYRDAVKHDGPAVEIVIGLIHPHVLVDEQSGPSDGLAGCEAHIPVHQRIGAVVPEEHLRILFVETAKHETFRLDPHRA